ncbi:MAG TPA: class I SAM-dependent methyltransferase [Caldilineaceae bacterium]|nr:class I SAM-dependent methyltransferase [Caldilineaceae bacterium]
MGDSPVCNFETASSLISRPSAHSLAREQAFWNDHIRHSTAYVFYDDAEYNRILELLDHNTLAGKRVLEIGCGAGVWTANLVALGAQVVHFDLTPLIVEVAKQRATPYVTYGLAADMHHLPFTAETFDIVFGSMVLHHAQSHTNLGAEVARILKPNGRGIFHENSAQNPLLMLARATLVGRWGIPKNSSADEHPLQVDEIDGFAKAFRAYQVHVGRMVLFQLAVKYLLKREHGLLFRLAVYVDNWLYQNCARIRPWSYYQIIVCDR